MDQQPRDLSCFSCFVLLLFVKLMYFKFCCFHMEIDMITIHKYVNNNMCDPCCQNESKCTQANFELQTKSEKCFRISGFHTNEFIKPSSSDPYDPN